MHFYKMIKNNSRSLRVNEKICIPLDFWSKTYLKTVASITRNLELKIEKLSIFYIFCVLVSTGKS